MVERRARHVLLAGAIGMAAAGSAIPARSAEDPPRFSLTPSEAQRGQVVQATGSRCRAEWAVVRLQAEQGGHQQQAEFRTEPDGSWWGELVVQREAIRGSYAATFWCRTGDAVSYADGASSPLWRAFQVVAGEVPRLTVAQTTVAPGSAVAATVEGCAPYDRALVSLQRDGKPVVWNGGDVRDGRAAVDVVVPAGTPEGQWFEAVGACESDEHRLQSNLVAVVVRRDVPAAAPTTTPPAPSSDKPPDPAAGAAPATETTTTTTASPVEAATHRPQAKQEGGGSDRATPALALLFLVGAGAASWHRLRRRPS